MTEDFYESIREVEPLYTSLKRESELVRGASLGLERLDRVGLASLGLQEMMAIPVWRIEGTFSDTSLESFLHGIKGYTPGIAPLLVEQLCASSSANSSMACSSWITSEAAENGPFERARRRPPVILCSQLH